MEVRPAARLGRGGFDSQLDYVLPYYVLSSPTIFWTMSKKSGLMLLNDIFGNFSNNVKFSTLFKLFQLKFDSSKPKDFSLLNYTNINEDFF